MCKSTINFKIIFQDNGTAICTQMYYLHTSSVDGEIYIYEYTILAVKKEDIGSYEFKVTFEESEFSPPGSAVEVVHFNASRSNKEPVQEHGTSSTLTCYTEKPAKGSTVTMTWYKTLDAIKSEKYEARDLVAMSTLELFGTWADSAQYRCLIEYSDPYIPPVWTEILAFAFVGLYRTSMYRYNLADKIALIKTTIDDLELSCYFQTSKRDTAPVAVWTTIEIGGTGAVLTPNGG